MTPPRTAIRNFHLPSEVQSDGPDSLRPAFQKVQSSPAFPPARLRYRGIHADTERVRLLMRAHGLQAPVKPRRTLGPRVHDGTITTAKPDEMWSTDATSVLLLDGRQATIFGVYDHCTCELMGIHAALEGNRYEAMVPLEQACRMAFGNLPPTAGFCAMRKERQ